jgi:4-amino-4-deoxy-L-arabinose transferase-like glycosyltransferase
MLRHYEMGRAVPEGQHLKDAMDGGIAVVEPAPVEKRDSQEPGGVSDPSAEQVQAWVLISALVAGVVCRAVYYESGRSLWIDEARVALNVGTRGYAALLRPLDYDQAASPLFLWGEKLMSQLFGMNERAFWLLPFVAGVLALILFVPMARRFLPGWLGVIVIASFGIAPTLVHFSANAKPYIGDLTFALAILLGAFAWIERPESRFARWLPFIGVIAPWASTPAIFTLLPAAGAMVLVAPRERRTRAILIGAVWLLSFAAVYALVYAPSSHNEYLEQFWSYSFLRPWDPGLENRLGAIRRDILISFSIGLYSPPTSPLITPLWFTRVQHWVSWLLLLVGAVGAVQLVRSRARWESLLLFGPVVLLAGASAFSRYPASTRLVLFLVPVFYLCEAVGASGMIGALPRQYRMWVVRAVVGLALGAQLVMLGRYLRWSPRIENTRDMIALLGPEARAPQVVYVQAGALPAWAFYSADWSHPDSARLARYAALGASDGAAFENAPSRGRVAPGEGWNLKFVQGNRVELLGVPAGTWLRPKQQKPAQVDLGWANNEVGRIRRAAGCDRSVWVLTSHSNGADAQLLDRLEEGGGRVAFAMVGLGDNLTRFDRPAGVCKP